MIIFTITSKNTGSIYVGSTRNDLKSQWKKMVTAAQQELNFPLYREILSQGEDTFSVEEWDRAETRSELEELEAEAIRFFNAQSLKGYKTSTVKILPKKKKRQRKSSIEREIVSIFTELNDDQQTPPSLNIKSAPHTNESTPSPFATGKVVEQKKKITEAARLSNTADTTPAPIQTEETVGTVQTPDSKTKPQNSLPKSEGSQLKAVVAMDTVDLSNDINSQLAAITAAADACLAGDTNAVTHLETSKNDIEQNTSANTQDVLTSEPEKPDTKPAEKPVCAQELRILEAIEKHRKYRATRSSETLENERKSIQNLLDDLESRAQEMALSRAA